MVRIRWTMGELSRKFVVERGIKKGAEERVRREGALKFMKDKIIGESNLAKKRLCKKDRLDECLRSARLDRLRV